MDENALREKAAMSPQKPGVYLMHDAHGLVLYVGKARNLKNRVSQYFQNTRGHGIKTQQLVRRVADFETIVTDSELEALVLENTLIKAHQPKYNILLKDDKGYPFVRLDLREQWPRLTLSPRAENDGARYFGPYGGRTIVHEVIDTLQELFRLPACKRVFPRDIGRNRPCLRLHLGRCIGVCAGSVDQEQYRGLLSQAVLLLEGRYDHLAATLREEMEAAAEELQFEKAARLRDRLQALEKLGQRQKVVAAHVPDADVVCLYNGDYKSCVVVLHYIDGMLLAKDRTLLDPCGDDTEAAETLSQFLGQYYRQRPMIPPQIMLSHDIPDAEVIGQWLSELRGRKVAVAHPQRGEKRKLLDMAMANAEEEARLATAREERRAVSLQLLQGAAGLTREPKRLEAFDISHTAGTDTVGGMVVFQGTSPLKKAYRRFRIRQENPEEYAAMEEMLRRRFTAAREGEEGFLPLPDVLLIDGGIQHAALAARVAHEMGADCAVLGMVKDDSHRSRALVGPDGSEIGLRTLPALFALVGTIQEEVHRYAIAYHRDLRGKSAAKSALDAVAGIGPARRAKLLRHFGSLKAVRAATIEELAAIIPKNAARTVYEHFHPAEKSPASGEAAAAEDAHTAQEPEKA